MAFFATSRAAFFATSRAAFFAASFFAPSFAPVRNPFAMSSSL